MIDSAIALQLDKDGFGTYGQTIFFGLSPIMDTGQVTQREGIYVNATTVSVTGDQYTDQITISTRFRDVLKQGRYLMRLLEWQRDTLCDTCELDCRPILDMSYRWVDIQPSTAVDMDAIDGEGRWIKAIRFTVSYKLPPELPPIG